MSERPSVLFPECGDFQAGTIKAVNTQGDHYETTYSTVHNVFVGSNNASSSSNTIGATVTTSVPSPRPIALSSQAISSPTIATSFHGLMSQLLGLFASSTLSHNETVNPLVLPALETASSGSSRSSRSEIHSIDSQSGAVTVASIEEPDEHVLNAEKLTTPEIFLCSLLGSGKGLPCWQPKPRKPFSGERGVVPGDVGTYSAEGGFEKLYNLWEDEVAIRERAAQFGETYQLHEKTVTLNDSELSKDDIIASPGTWSDVEYGPDGLTPARIDFRCGARQGAVVIPTSTAKLEQLTNHSTLRKTLVQSAGLLYMYANSVRQIGDEESLYFITGCIKSESWALAAYRDPLPPPYDVLRLVKRPPAASQISERIPPYAWTKRGTSEARVGASEAAQVMDQSLFLRGYKMAFSQDFRAQMDRRLRLSTDSLHSQENSGRDRSDSSKNLDHGSNDRNDGGSGGLGRDTVAGMPGSTETVQDGVCVGLWPNSPHKSFHPSDTMTGHLLQKTGANVALIHDDDWRFDMEGASLFEVNTDCSFATPQEIVIEQGVAYLKNPSLDISDEVETPSRENKVAEEKQESEGSQNSTLPPPSSLAGPDSTTDDSAKADKLDCKESISAEQTSVAREDAESDLDEPVKKNGLTEKMERRTELHYRLSDFTILRTLGTGSFGRVHLAQSNHNRRFYAIKVLNKERVVKTKQTEHTNNETRMLKDVQHPFIINLWGSFQDTGNLYMVMDFVPGGELFALLRRSKRFPNAVAKFYAAEVAVALNYLHSLDIVYRDLKPENILLTAEGHIKVADFGFAKVCTTTTWTLCGTPDYLAPEVVSQSRYNKSVDWYALGVLVFEMLSGFPPYHQHSTNHLELYEKILAGPLEIKMPSAFDGNACNLILKLMEGDPSRRYGNMRNGAGDVFEHPWFEEVDWDKLANRQINAPYIPRISGDGDACAFDHYPEDDVASTYGLSQTDPYGAEFPDFEYTNGVNIV